MHGRVGRMGTRPDGQRVAWRPSRVGTPPHGAQPHRCQTLVPGSAADLGEQTIDHRVRLASVTATEEVGVVQNVIHVV